ncbi:arsenite methyltransferase-like [Gigantopelta aegis]|uniref:arsenite methyltransferase-like n=1 Tax=Gigantopelta aegis TaxID=1735272 RepID=UPI001B88D1B0|nr:arsenite methyltransferase-like [Gigantopelta aegis]
MADHEITKKISESYNDLVLSCDFVCNVNEPDLTEEERVIVKKLHPETMKRYHGSGLAIPSHVQGCKILDVGSGSGSLVFILSKLVGPKGHVTGVDIASNMTDISRKYRKYHCDLWGLSQPNIEFHCGNAERLKEDFGFKDNSFDIIVSNGVLCLCPNKEKVLASIHSTLKEGGEFYLNDVYMPANKPQKSIRLILCFGVGTNLVSNHTNTQR